MNLKPREFSSYSSRLKEFVHEGKRVTFVGAAALLATTMTGCGNIENNQPPTSASVEELARTGCEPGVDYDITGYAVKVDEESSMVPQPLYGF